VDHSPRSSV